MATLPICGCVPLPGTLNYSLPPAAEAWQSTVQIRRGRALYFRSDQGDMNLLDVITSQEMFLVSTITLITVFKGILPNPGQKGMNMSRISLDCTRWPNVSHV